MSDVPSAPGYTALGVRAQLRTLILGRRIEVYPQVSSTNDLAKELGRLGEPEGLVIATEEQVQGRGRLGRAWVAPPGCCVLCSVLLRPRFSPDQAFYLTISTAMAIYRAARSLFEAREIGNQPCVTIKWPNDVLVGGRKVAGILSESEFGPDGWEFAVVGFGINANLDREQLGELRATATSLSLELGYEVDRARLLARVLTELESLYLSLQNGQFGAVYSQWVAALETVGKRVSVWEAGAPITGQALRVDHDGALVLRLDNGQEQRVIAGDIGAA